MVQEDAGKWWNKREEPDEQLHGENLNKEQLCSLSLQGGSLSNEQLCSLSMMVSHVVAGDQEYQSV